MRPPAHACCGYLGSVESPRIQRLRQELAQCRAERRGKGRKRAPIRKHETKRSKCGPNGEVREHPLMVSLMWLHTIGQALILSGVCFDSEIDIKGWERDGCLGLKLQQAVVGPLGTTGGLWENRRIPVEMVNAQDTRAVLKKLFEPSVADLVFASNNSIRLLHHGN